MKERFPTVYTIIMQHYLKLATLKERHTVMDKIDRRSFLCGTGAMVLVGTSTVAKSASAAVSHRMTVYRSPTCGCCGAWIKHIQTAGIKVDAVELDDLSTIKTRYGITSDLQSCHTGIINGYVVEGHVPVKDVVRMLEERPEIAGIAVPGMPIGSPGMEMGNQTEPYVVLAFGASGVRLFSDYR